MNDLDKRITTDKDILGGKPIIAGTRISVELILSILSSGMTIEEILEEYPHLTKEDILACVAYARDIVQDFKLFRYA